MIDKFDGPYAWLSNFYESPFTYNNITYKTIEHYFQSEKILDQSEKVMVINASTPGKAKRLGRKFKMIKNWDSIKLIVMFNGLFEKFDQNLDLKQALIDTGDVILIEGNRWHDNFWGDCRCPKCKNIRYMNHLGKALMNLRKMFKK